VFGTYTADAYDIGTVRERWRSIAAAVGSVWVASAAYLLLPLLTPALPQRRIEVLSLPVVAMLFICVWRYVYAVWVMSPTLRIRCVILGAGAVGEMLASALRQVEGGKGDGRNCLYDVLGYVDDDPSKQGQHKHGFEVIGTSHTLSALAKRGDIDEVLLAMRDSGRITEAAFGGLMDAREAGIPITPATVAFERLTGRVPVHRFSYDLHVLGPHERHAAFRAYIAAKRVADIAVASIGCLMTAMLAPLILFANMISSPGPLFFTQQRVGRGGRLFTLVKFRSMVQDAERDGWRWASKSDPRVTAVGRFLRVTRLDELPQFWNVLRGEMSIIGPRPERPEAVQLISEHIPCYRARHAVKPGITGWAQVRYRYGSSVEDALMKLEHDLYYVKNMAIELDVRIALRTIVVMLTMRGC
jgi:exopolysaccharide biosynthesis polyprenyl glycosylphosphotransferase